MNNYYNIDAINFIFNKFKVKNVIFMESFKGIDEIRKYCDENSIAYDFINANEYNVDNISEPITLNKLKNIKNYDAIFLNDDANWYTVYNELNIIKNNNDTFPLVFICNNIFPNQRRDSYRDPSIIPKEFLNEFSDEFTYNEICLSDGLFHAIELNTPKNGVLTAIEDFLSENYSIGLSNMKFINGIVILYFKNSISHIRWGRLEEDLKDHVVEPQEFSNNNLENKYLTDYISKFNQSKDTSVALSEFENEMNKKDALIAEYEDLINLHDIELDYKNSQIKGMDSKLNLKDSKIRNMESQLSNYENNIKDLNNKINKFNEDSLQYNERNAELNNQLHNANSQIDSLKSEFDLRCRDFKNKESDLSNQLRDANSQIDSLKSEFDLRCKDFENKESDLSNQLRDANSQIDSLKSEFDLRCRDFKNKESDLSNQLRSANSQIDSLKSEFDLRRKDFENVSNSKNSQLRRKEDELRKIKQQYSNQLSKLDSKEYCISCFKEEMDNNHMEIEYLKNTSFIKKILNPFSILYLIIKSNPKELVLNYKLYKSLKNSKCFDIGYYLNKNKDIQKSKWCKYFSPELHYVCYGFDEKRKFNKKYFNRNSKKELLEYIINCP